MASPPAGSPPSGTGLSLPRQRPTLALPTKSRKSSLAPSTGSAHPLRQTSFPPPDLEAQHREREDLALAQFSPGAEDSLDDFSDSEITSAISGPVGDDGFTRKRKRAGEKRPRGRPAKNVSIRAGSTSLVNGEEGRSGRRGGTAGAASVAADGGEDGDEDEEEDEKTTTANTGFNDADLKRDNQRKFLFREVVNPHHQERYDTLSKARLQTADVRRLVNATLSQSVPQNVVVVVQAYAKMFAGMLIEGARDVQAEWMAANPTTPDGEEMRAYKRMKMMQAMLDEVKTDSPEDGQEVVEKSTDEPEGEAEDAKPKVDGLPEGDPMPEDEGEPNHARAVTDTQPGGDSQPGSLVNGSSHDDAKKEEEEEAIERDKDVLDDFEHAQPGAWGLSKYVEECDRGPLLPDHLRESLRRYKKSRSGGMVGYTGISLERPEVAAPRMGGRRLFR